MNELEKSLKENGIYVTLTKGDSMMPMLTEGKNKVVIVPPEFPLKKFDVPVYRRMGHYTMHRIIGTGKNGYIICGDNRTRLERDITDEDIVGMLDGFFAGDRYISRTDKEFVSFGKKACRTYWIRLAKRYVKAILRRIKECGVLKRPRPQKGKNNTDFR